MITGSSGVDARKRSGLTPLSMILVRVVIIKVGLPPERCAMMASMSCLAFPFTVAPPLKVVCHGGQGAQQFVFANLVISGQARSA